MMSLTCRTAGIMSARREPTEAAPKSPQKLTSHFKNTSCATGDFTILIDLNASKTTSCGGETTHKSVNSVVQRSDNFRSEIFCVAILTPSCIDHSMKAHSCASWYSQMAEKNCKMAFIMLTFDSWKARVCSLTTAKRADDFVCTVELTESSCPDSTNAVRLFMAFCRSNHCDAGETKS